MCARAVFWSFFLFRFFWEGEKKKNQFFPKSAACGKKKVVWRERKERMQALNLSTDKRPYAAGFKSKCLFFMPLNRKEVSTSVSFLNLEEWEDNEGLMYVLRRVMFSKSCADLFEVYKETDQIHLMDGPDIFQVQVCTKRAPEVEEKNDRDISEAYTYGDVVATVYHPILSKIPVVDVQFEKSGELLNMQVNTEDDTDAVVKILTDKLNIKTAYEFTRNSFMKNFVYG